MTSNSIKRETHDLSFISDKLSSEVNEICSTTALQGENCRDRKLTVGSLFAGIGALDLGLERTGGFQIKWQVEIDNYCRRVLERHWPHVRRYEDIRKVKEVESVDVLCGGFPCQDISYAGYGVGIEGDRSGLWFEMARLIPVARPRIVIVENVAALLDRGMGEVLRTLAGLGFDAEWSDISACAMGAAHMRRRVFIVAYANGVYGWPRLRDSDARWCGTLQTVNGFEDSRTRTRARLANPSELYRNSNGVTFGLERNRAIGNSVYPDVGEWIGQRILDYERSLTSEASS